MRDLRVLPTDTTGAALTIGRTITLAGKTYQPGDAPPDNIRDDPGLGSMLRKGYLLSSVPLNTRDIRPTPEQKKPIKIQKPVEKPTDETATNGELSMLRDLSIEDSPGRIRAALDVAGVEYPPQAKRKTLLAIRDQAIRGE